MSDYPHVNAAFINAIAEEGTKAEAIQYLQKQWNETCALRARLEQAERARDEWKAATNRSQNMYYAGGFRAGIEAAAERIESIGFSAGLIRALPINPDATAALNEMLADAWDEGWNAVAWMRLRETPYRKDET